MFQSSSGAEYIADVKPRARSRTMLATDHVIKADEPSRTFVIPNTNAGLESIAMEQVVKTLKFSAENRMDIIITPDMKSEICAYFLRNCIPQVVGLKAYMDGRAEKLISDDTLGRQLGKIYGETAVKKIVAAWSAWNLSLAQSMRKNGVQPHQPGVDECLEDAVREIIPTINTTLMQCHTENIKNIRGIHYLSTLNNKNESSKIRAAPQRSSLRREVCVLEDASLYRPFSIEERLALLQKNDQNNAL